jgi:hypothetical protein
MRSLITLSKYVAVTSAWFGSAAVAVAVVAAPQSIFPSNASRIVLACEIKECQSRDASSNFKCADGYSSKKSYKLTMERTRIKGISPLGNRDNDQTSRTGKIKSFDSSANELVILELIEELGDSPTTQLMTRTTINVATGAFIDDSFYRYKGSKDDFLETSSGTCSVFNSNGN